MPGPAWLESASCLANGGQSAERGKRVLGLGTRRVVGITLRVADHALLVDDEAGRDGQRPRGIAVELLEVQGEREIELVKIVGQPEAQPESARYLVATVGEDLEREVPGPNQLPVVLRQLRRDGHEARPEPCQFRLDRLQSHQLRIAIGSPAAAIERYHKGAPLAERP